MNTSEVVIKPQGHISLFEHTGDLEFVSLSSEDPTHGYFKLRGENVVQERHMKNLIVSRASQFIAKRMRPSTSWGAGITHLEVGTGVGTGTTSAPQAESSSQTALRVPLFRKAITSWTYLDAVDAPTATETNVVQITTTFATTEAVGGLVEMGLFGGDATATNGSGYMFNYKVFPIWNKTNTVSLTVVWKLTF